MTVVRVEYIIQNYMSSHYFHAITLTMHSGSCIVYNIVLLIHDKIDLLVTTRKYFIKERCAYFHNIPETDGCDLETDFDISASKPSLSFFLWSIRARMPLIDIVVAFNARLQHSTSKSRNQAQFLSVLKTRRCQFCIKRKYIEG